MWTKQELKCADSSTHWASYDSSRVGTSALSAVVFGTQLVQSLFLEGPDPWDCALSPSSAVCSKTFPACDRDVAWIAWGSLCIDWLDNPVSLCLWLAQNRRVVWEDDCLPCASRNLTTLAGPAWSRLQSQAEQHSKEAPGSVDEPGPLLGGGAVGACWLLFCIILEMMSWRSVIFIWVTTHRRSTHW